MYHHREFGTTCSQIDALKRESVATSKAIKGRGSQSNIPGRFEIRQFELNEDGETPRNPATVIQNEAARSLLTRNHSPDVPFNLSVNPYRGCEHGCVYCFARPSHAYLDLSPGLDFETRITVKHNAAEVFEQELRRPGYRCEPIALGINTDAYQPAEKEYGITRQLLEIALRFKQPVSIITKSALILRDRDLLAEMAEQNLIQVAVSMTSLDNRLKRILEPRAADAASRLRIIKSLREAGIPVAVLIAPVIPLLNEREMEQIVEAVADAGAQSVNYILLRLPYEVAPLFVDWLYQHFPQRAGHVLARIKDMRGGKLYESRFEERMRGQGIFAELIHQRFHLARKKFGLDQKQLSPLDCSRFAPPPQAGDQLSLL